MIMRDHRYSGSHTSGRSGDWWVSEQFVDGYPGGTVDHTAPHVPSFMDKGWMHGPPFVREDGLCFCGYCGDGLYILDVNDPYARNVWVN